MKKVIVLTLIVFASLTANSQTKRKINPYISYGLSMTNSSDFKTSSYTGIEGGIMRENAGAGLVFGRGSLAGLGKSTDDIRNYFYEAKVFASYPIGALSGNLLFGYGGYINTPHQFIEYGVGISYTAGKFSYGATYSNWDGVNYITPNITFNF